MTLEYFHTRPLLVGLLCAISVSCNKSPKEELPNYLEQGLYQSKATGDEIIINHREAFITFKGEKFVLAAFKAHDDGVLTFSPIKGRENEFERSTVSKSNWSWEPRTIRQQSDTGTVLQSFSLYIPDDP
jgi:hypothetical protein